MVGLDGLAVVPDVDAHQHEVLPDLPVLKVAFQGLLQHEKGSIPAGSQQETDVNVYPQRLEPREGPSDSLILEADVGGGEVVPRFSILKEGEEDEDEGRTCGA